MCFCTIINLYLIVTLPHVDVCIKNMSTTLIPTKRLADYIVKGNAVGMSAYDIFKTDKTEKIKYPSDEELKAYNLTKIQWKDKRANIKGATKTETIIPQNIAWFEEYKRIDAAGGVLPPYPFVIIPGSVSTLVPIVVSTPSLDVSSSILAPIPMAEVKSRSKKRKLTKVEGENESESENEDLETKEEELKKFLIKMMRNARNAVNRKYGQTDTLRGITQLADRHAEEWENHMLNVFANLRGEHVEVFGGWMQPTPDNPRHVYVNSGWEPQIGDGAYKKGDKTVIPPWTEDDQIMHDEIKRQDAVHAEQESIIQAYMAKCEQERLKVEEKAELRRIWCRMLPEEKEKCSDEVKQKFLNAMERPPWAKNSAKPITC